MLKNDCVLFKRKKKIPLCSTYLQRLLNKLDIYANIYWCVYRSYNVDLYYHQAHYFCIACPTTDFSTNFYADCFEPYTTGIPYVYSSLPVHNQLQIWEFNKCIVKLQEIFRGKRATRWFEYENTSPCVTRFEPLSMNRAWDEQLTSNLAIMYRSLAKEWGKEDCSFKTFYHFCLIFHCKVSKWSININ